MTPPTAGAGAALRITLFTYSTKPRGGVIHTLALAEHLQELGHAVHIFALGKDQTGFFRPTTVPFTLIPIGVLPDDIALDERITRYIQAYYDFLMAHQSRPFDIYHAQDCVSANALWRLRAEGRIPAFVRTVHHVDDFVSPSLIQCQNDSIYRPDQRIVVSRYWQRRLQAEFGVASEVIYNGVDLQRFHPPGAGLRPRPAPWPGRATRALRARSGLTRMRSLGPALRAGQRDAARAALDLGDAFVVLNIGGVEPRKNTVRLLRAFERLTRELERVGRASILLLPGGETLLDHTPYRQEFLAALAASGLATAQRSDVRLLGVVADEQVPALYHAADMLAFPSVKEGWGLAVLEALASDLPVLASDLPVFREYLRHEDNALLVDPLDEAAIAAGMVRLAQDEATRRRLAAAGRDTARQFSWQTTAQAHVACYHRWLPQRPCV
jgi:glycosyltransferase involved in cell wall biosynthesis